MQFQIASGIPIAEDEGDPRDALMAEATEPRSQAQARLARLTRRDDRFFLFSEARRIGFVSLRRVHPTWSTAECLRDARRIAPEMFDSVVVTGCCDLL